MNQVEKADKNLRVAKSIGRDDMVLYNVCGEPFTVCGLVYGGGMFRRMPEEAAKSVSEGVLGLHTCTAGGRLRFRTDSEFVAICAKMPQIYKGPHMPLTASAGFDLYVYENGADKFIHTFMPPMDMIDGYESIKMFGPGEMREYTLHFPLYSSVSELYIGVKEGATVEAGRPYRKDLSIVYYGSSITQGGCASRPGNAYANILSRRYNCDHVNLGFSGSAKGEQAMADYIKQLNMDLFVYDYDENAPSAEYLAQTHEKMFRTIRQAHPDLPVIMMTQPRSWLFEHEKERFSVIQKTYLNAVAEGDRNVYLLPGTELMKEAGPDGTVDNLHPTDLGFASMAKVLGDEIGRIMNLNKEN